MPNWCSNKLIVHGNDVPEFIKANKGEATDLTFNAAVPIEPWDYDRACNEWGTKWDVDGELIDSMDDFAEYRFESAWCPPEFWLDAVAKKWPSLDFELKYDEPGMEFSGRIMYSGGVETEHDRRDWAFGGSF